jgi:hypothetical protein
VSSPTGTASTVLSLLPPFAPALMPVLMATGDAASWQITLAIALAVATAVGLTWLAGRIYANSVLRFGARVRFLDALRGKQPLGSGAQPTRRDRRRIMQGSRQKRAACFRMPGRTRPASQ